MNKIPCLDSNIILLDAKNILQHKEVCICYTVLKEIDSKKGELGEVGYNAREFSRLMTRGEIKDVKSTEDANIITIHIDDTIVYLIYSDVVNADAEINDAKIVNYARLFSTIMNREVVFLSQDLNARVVAIVKDVETKGIADVKDVVYEYHKNIILSPEAIQCIDGEDVSKLPFHTPHTHTYKFIDDHSGQVKLACVINGKINVLTKKLETEIRHQEVNPINSEQQLLAQAILNDKTNIIVVEAQSGSGKTVSAFSNAMRLVSTGKCNGIMYVRNSINDVPKNEEVGYLSTNEAKFEVYLHPVRDTLYFMAREKLKSSKLKASEMEAAIDAKIESMIKEYNISTSTLLGMRGRTFTDMVIIVDEAQNLSPASMQKLITRTGKGSKLIIIGSNRQIDNAFVTKYDNGLSILMQNSDVKFEGVSMFVIQLSKVVRSAIAEFGEKLFSKEIGKE